LTSSFRNGWFGVGLTDCFSLFNLPHLERRKRLHLVCDYPELLCLIHEKSAADDFQTPKSQVFSLFMQDSLTRLRSLAIENDFLVQTCTGFSQNE
jgi:hypothetical protein